MSIGDDKRAILGQTSADKRVELAGTSTVKQAQMSATDRFNASIARVNAGDTPGSRLRERLLNQKSAEADPNSEQNKGKIYTAKQLRDNDPGALVGNAILGGIKGFFDDVAGPVVELVHGGASSRLGALRTDDRALELYAKEQGGEKLSAEEATYMEGNVHQAVDQEGLGDYSSIGLEADTLSRRDNITKTRRDSARSLAAREESVDFFDGGRFNEALTNDLMAEIATKTDKYAPQVQAAIQALGEGDVVGTVKGFPALAAALTEGLITGVQNPAAASQLIAEEAPDLLMAAAGKLGLVVTAVESFARFVNVSNRGLQDYIERTGKAPDGKFIVQNFLAAAGYTGMDLIGDFAPSKAINKILKKTKGAGQAFDGTIFAATEAVKKTPGKIKTIAKVTKAVAEPTIKAAATEGVTEFAQKILEEGPAKGKAVSLKDVKDALLEGSAGAIAGPGVTAAGVTAAVGDKALHKTADVIEKIITPASEEMKKVKKQLKSPTTAEFKGKVADAVETGDASKLADPESAEFDPKAAVKAAKEIHDKNTSDPEEQTKQYQVAKGVVDSITEIQIQIADRGLDPEDSMTEDEANALIDKHEKLKAEIIPLAQAMGKQGPMTSELEAAIEKATDTLGITAAIKETFGSRGFSNIDEKIDFDEVANSPDYDGPTKVLVAAIQKLGASKKALTAFVTANAHSTEEVTENIFTGSGGQKGINNHITAITNGVNKLAEGKGPKALDKALADLDTFAKGHRAKAVAFRNTLNGKATAADTALIAELSKARVKAGKTAYKVKPDFERSIKAMEMESDALEDAYALGLNIAGQTSPRQGSRTEEVIAAPSATPASEQSQPISDQGPATPGVEASLVTKWEAMTVDELKDEYRNTPVENEAARNKIAEIARKKKEPAPKVTPKPKVSEAQAEEGAQPDVKPEAEQTEEKETEAIINETLTTPTSKEDTNKVRQTYNAIRANSKFQKIANFAQWMTNFVKEKAGKLKSDDARMMTQFVNFNAAMTVAVDALFYKKAAGFEDQDPMSYLLKDGETRIPPYVIEAITATVHKWIATRAKETNHNDDKNIRGIMNLAKEAYVIHAAQTILGGLGSPASTLSETLGKDILAMIGIKAGDKALAQDQERLEISLGLMALASMEKMGILERSTIDQNAFNRLKIATETMDTTFKMDKSEMEAVSGQTNIKYFKIIMNKDGNYAGQMTPKAQQIRDRYMAAKDTWDSLFAAVRDRYEYSWNKIVATESDQEEMARKSQEPATVEQTANKVRNEGRSYNLATQTMHVFAALSENVRNKIMGVKSEKDAQKENVQAVRSTNNSLTRAWDDMLVWLYDSGKHGGTGTKFWIPAWFGANGRMYQEGTINPQGSLVHRFLFSMTDWVQTFKPGKNIAAELKFIEAVGLGLGLEAAKKAEVESVIIETQDRLATEVMLAGLESIKKILGLVGDTDTFNLDTAQKMGADTGLAQDMDNIAAAVAEGKEEVHTFKVLVEYARYQMAQDADEDFTTDLPFEIDGLANGPIIASLQLMLEITPRLLGILMSGGLSFKDAIVEGMHMVTNDPYKAIGAIWGNNVQATERKIAEEATQLGVSDKEKAEALQKMTIIRAGKALIGGLHDLTTGLLAKDTRKLAKNRSVGALYGSGHAAVINGLLGVVLENIRKKLEELAAEPNKPESVQAFRDLVKQVHELAGMEDGALTDNFVIEGGVLKPAGLLKMDITSDGVKGIHANLTQYHGADLNKAIDDVYGNIKDARKPLNRAIQFSAVRYNAAMQMLIDKKMAEKKEKGEPEELTVGDLKEIKIKLRPLFPRVKTPMGGYIEIADFEKTLDYNNANNKQVRPTYNSETTGISRLSGYPHEINFLEDPGVKPVVTIIHMLDSMVANMLIGNKDDIGVLNVHDGFLTNITKAATTSELANKHIADITRNYSVAGAVEDSAKATEVAYMELLKAEGLSGKANTAMTTAADKFDRLIKPGKELSDEIKASKTAVARTKKVTDANRMIVVNATTNWNQYYMANGGYFAEDENGDPIKEQKYIGPVPVDAIIPLAQQGVRDQAAFNLAASLAIQESEQDIQQEIMYSSDNTMSQKASDYLDMDVINSQNVVETFESIKNVTNQEGETGVQDSPEHEGVLRGLLNTLVKNVMDPIDLYLKTNPDDETHGQIVIEEKGTNNRIFISSQTGIATEQPTSGALTHGIRMSTGEVYVHELVHGVIVHGLRASKHLLRQVETLYDIAEANLTYKAFLNDPALDVDDLANHYEVEAAKKRFARVFRGKSINKDTYVDSVTGMQHTTEPSSHLDEFVTLGLTNENFRNALFAVSTVKHQKAALAKGPWDGLFGKNLQETIMNMLGRIMDFLYTKFQKGTPANTVGEELERLAHLMVKIDSKNKTKIYNAHAKLDGVWKKFADSADRYIRKAFTSAPVLKTGYYLRRGTEIAYDSKTPLGTALRTVKYKYEGLDYGVTKSIVTEMAGETVRMKPFHQLLHRRKVFLDASKLALTKNVKAAIGAFFTRELSIEEKVAMHKVGIKTDISVLLNYVDMGQIKKYVSSNDDLDARVAELKRAMNEDGALKPFMDYFDQSADALGWFMVHGVFRDGEWTFPSAYAIASLKGTKNKGALSDADINKANEYVDQLASLYALKYTKGTQRNAVVALLNEDQAGVEKTLRLHNQMKKEAVDDLFNNNKFQFIKGYTKEILNTRLEFKIATKEEGKVLKQLGYKRSEKLPRDPADPTKSTELYMYIADTGRVNDYLSTIASLASNIAKGTSSEDLARVLDLSTQQGRDNNAKVVRDKQRQLDAMFERRQTPKPGGNSMVPQLDADGNIVKFRYMMSEETKDNFFDKVNEFDTVMGAMAGQILDKVRTPEINRNLVDLLKDMYEKEYHKNPQNFIEIGAHSQDTALREKYYLLPAKTRAYIEEQWGGPHMMVAKDVMHIAFGYRKYSLTQAFAKTPADRIMVEKIVVGAANLVFQSYGIKVVTTSERVLMTLAKIAKNNIVVKSLYVTLDNLTSNFFLLRMKGVATSDILKYGWEALSKGIQYQNDKEALEQAKITQAVLTDPREIRDIEARIIKLKDRLARNPVRKAMEAGMLPSIVDDVETDVTQDNFPSRTTKFIDKALTYIPKPLVNIGKVILLTQDTGAYKILNNAVKMTDFIGRYILYQHLMKEGKAKAGYNPEEDADKLHQESVMYVMGQFINFDLPTHPAIEYLNETGIFFFSKYLFRVQKIIAQTAIDKPFTAGSALLMATHFDLDNIGQSSLLVKDVMQNVGSWDTAADTVGQILPINILGGFFK